MQGNINSIKNIKEFLLHKNNKQAYKQLGNSVNVDVVRFIVKNMFNIK